MDFGTFQNQAMSKHGKKRQDRMIAFFDAVVAVGITMIVMGIELPPEEISSAKLVAYIGSEITVYLVSFIALAELWRVHHAVFTFFEDMADEEILNVHMVMMFFVTIFPLLTRIMNAYKEMWEIRVLYIASYVIINSLMVIMISMVNKKQIQKQLEQEETVKKILPMMLAKDKTKEENIKLYKDIEFYSELFGKNKRETESGEPIPKEIREMMAAWGLWEIETPNEKRVRTIQVILSIGLNFFSIMLSVIVLMINPFICYLIFSIRFVLESIGKRIVAVCLIHANCENEKR